MKSLFQTKPWLELKARHGWTIVPADGQFLLERTFLGRFRLLYGPEVSLPTTKDKRLAMFQTIRGMSRERQVFAARLDIFAEWDDQLADELTSLGWRKSFEEIQPEFRQWLDLHLTEAELLTQMKPKGRYNIRLGQRHGVVVGPSHDVEAFVQLLAETGRRDGFAVRSPIYYQEMVKILEEHKLGELLLASYQGQPLAGAIASFADGIASYLHGASSSAHRDVMAPFLLHWTIIQRAKARGCHTYDLLAVAPTEEFRIREKFVGISRFKRQFGGRTVRLMGAWDYVNQPAIYAGFQLAEWLRRR